MVGQDQFLGGRDPWIEERRDQSMFLAMTWPAGIIEGIADEPDQDRLPTSAAVRVARPQPDELGTVVERAYRLRFVCGGEPPEEVGSPSTGGRDGSAAVEAAIPQEQAPAPHRAEEAPSGRPFIGIPGPEPGIADGVGATLAEGDDLHAWPGAGAPRTRLPPKGMDVGRGVGHVERSAIEGHQPEAEQKSARSG
jgi:hypothetical protein